MKRHELVERLSVYFPELRKRDVEALVEAFFEELAKCLKQGGRIEFRGFGRFELHKGKERVFVNPKNKETYYLPGNKRLVFKVGKDLKERVNTKPIAALDLGTQTFRLALGKEHSEGIRIIGRERRNVRLGEGLSEGVISKEAMERGLEALREFKELMDRLEVERYKAVGTAVFRKAKNSQEFLDRAKGLGIEVEVISPEEETSLVLSGISLGLGLGEGRHLVVDVGGGSTEVAFLENGSVSWKRSFPVGAVVLSGELKGYPVSREEFGRLREKIREVLLEQEWPKGLDSVVGCGGTASLIASLDLRLTRYAPERIHSHSVSKERVEEILEHLKELSLSKISRVRGMEKGREDIAVPGIAIYNEILRLTDSERLTVSEWGLLEGVLFSI